MEITFSIFVNRRRSSDLTLNCQSWTTVAAGALKRPKTRSLSEGSWLGLKQNLLLTGATGSGKTYLACALGRTMPADIGIKCITTG
ncbi:ATP-binding protein [Serratia quinivorans]|uniref:ATP-binding protein n=1 Tax=Serratia quinivorans TaxID=137545 RepID=UPI002E76CA8E|nr:ATP-binding protein [Serratia quinivorans]